MAKNSTKNVKGLYYALLGIALGLYLYLTFTAKVTNNVYNLTPHALLLIRLSIAAPIIVIWSAAVFGAARVKNYALSIIDSEDGKLFNQLANGLTLFVAGIITQSLWTTTANNLWPSPAHPMLKAVVANYLALGFSLAAFYLMSKAAYGLVQFTKAGAELKKRILASWPWFVVFVSMYVGLFFANPNRNRPTVANVTSYWLPDSVLAGTIVIPYVVLWIMGITTALCIATYRQSVKGSLYQNALKGLSRGLMAITMSSIFLQMLGTIGSLLVGVSLTAILILIYVILIIYAIGYIFIATGARKLQKIEEVQ